MKDMNDYYVRNDCTVRVHIGGYVFTIEELFKHAVQTMPAEELLAHEEHAGQNVHKAPSFKF
jgi:hypothetical protein